MNKTAYLICAWPAFTLILSLLWYLRLNDFVIIGLAALGSLVGFLLPVFLDVLLPYMMTGSAKMDKTFATQVIRESLTQVKTGNLHNEQVISTPLRSYPLLFAYMFAALFVITSTQNWFGRGFVLGLGFSLVADIFFARDPLILRPRWFSVFHTNLSDVQLKYFVYITIGGFGVLTLLAILI